MKKPAWLTRKVLVRGVAALAIGGAAIALVYGVQSGNMKAGIGSDETVTKSEKRDTQGNITETTTLTTFQDAKTLWDWLSLLGVPFSLAILGYVLQQLQQAHAEQQAKTEKDVADQRVKVEKDIAESNQREEALQNYLDRLSDLLIDKNIIAIAVKLQLANENQPEGNPPPQIILEEKELLNAAINVIRARTLSILRRLGQDRYRKGDIIRFLIEAEIISKLKLNLSDAALGNADLSNIHLKDTNLSGADFSKANLSGANLSGANLSGANLCGVLLSDANLSGANLTFAYLSDAHLYRTNFRDANLSGANLSGANLSSANLSGANLTFVQLKDTDLSDANLSGANFSDAIKWFWAEEQFVIAKLCKTTLPKGCNLNPNRDCEALGIPLDPPATDSPE